MSNHPSHNMHEHSLAAYATLDLKGRKREIFDFLLTCTIPLTDRQIAARMGHGRDWVQPRISDMIKDEILEDCGGVECTISGKTVRLVRVRR